MSGSSSSPQTGAAILEPLWLWYRLPSNQGCKVNLQNWLWALQVSFLRRHSKVCLRNREEKTSHHSHSIDKWPQTDTAMNNWRWRCCQCVLQLKHLTRWAQTDKKKQTNKAHFSQHVISPAATINHMLMKSKHWATSFVITHRWQQLCSCQSGKLPAARRACGGDTRYPEVITPRVVSVTADDFEPDAAVPLPSRRSRCLLSCDGGGPDDGELSN